MGSPLEPVDGVFLFDKPKGLSSNVALQKVRHLFKAEKAGHTGTLDPEATGLLPICFGEATKFSSYLLDAVKGYRADIRLGEVSTTGDREGVITPTGRALPRDSAPIEAALKSLIGPQLQRPPMHSAVKQGGQPLYTLARQGIEVERPPRAIEIFELDLLSFDGPSLVVHTLCSKGTYIRVLAETIGDALGVGGWLSGLRRTHTGGFRIEASTDLETLMALSLEERRALLKPVDCLVSELPSLDVDAVNVRALQQGQSPQFDGVAPGDTIYRILEGERFIGLAKIDQERRLKVVRLMSTAGALK